MNQAPLAAEYLMKDLVQKTGLSADTIRFYRRVMENAALMKI